MVYGTHPGSFPVTGIDISDLEVSESPTRLIYYLQEQEPG
jgi:hypothetical protein